jgi:hypothetical protein
MKNITPHDLRCTWGACPAVYELNDGQLLIVGQRASVEQIAQCEVMVGDDEYAIVISKKYFVNLAEAEQSEK